MAASCRTRQRSAATGWSTRCIRAATPSSPTRTRSSWDADGHAFFAPTPEAMARRGILNFHVQIETNPYPGIKGYVADLACLTPEWTEWISEQLGHASADAARRSMSPGSRRRGPTTASRFRRPIAMPPACRASSCTGPRTRSTTAPCSKACACSARRSPPSDIGRLHISDWVRDGSPYPDGMELAGNHHMGGTRMSADPATGVVDADCKVHGMDNLFVAGSSVFATSGQCTPTTTHHRAGRCGSATI